jgi:hypothetical protein
MKKVWLGFVAALLIMPAAVKSQEQTTKPEAPAPEFFRLDFVVKEADAGKTVNSHSYQMMIAVNERAKGSVKSGARVPIGSPNNLTYIDVGMNIDVYAIHRVKEELAMDVSADISGATDNSTPPVVRQARWSSSVVVPVRKSTVLFATDDPSSKRQLSLEVTANPVH